MENYVKFSKTNLSKRLQKTLADLDKIHASPAAQALRDELEDAAQNNACYRCEAGKFHLVQSDKTGGWTHEITGCSEFALVLENERFPQFCTSFLAAEKKNEELA